LARAWCHSSAGAGYRLRHGRRIGNARLCIDFVTLDVQYQRGGCCADAVSAHDVKARCRCRVDANDGGLTLQLTFDPVHDRLGDEAGRSAVGEEIDHRRLSRGDQSVKVLG